MLLRIKVRNYLSFNEEASFDMFPNPKRTTFSNHIYKYEIPLLKQAAIYGENGSGKSNLLKSVEFIRSFATNKEAIKGINFFTDRFRLKRDFELPVFFSIEFFHKGIFFLYNIEVTTGNITLEELYLSGLGNQENKLIYSRKGLEITTSENLNEAVKEALIKVLSSNLSASLMSLNHEFPILDNRVEIAFEWFRENLHLKSLHSYNKELINLMEENPDLMSFANNIILKIGLGVEKLEIKEEKLNEVLGDDDQDKDAKDLILNLIKKDGRFTHMSHDKILFSIEEKDGEQVIKRFLFSQLGVEGYIGSLGFDSQSDGTAKIMNLIPVLYDLIHKECVFFIDEIENSIHPTLIVALMKFFSQTETKGQLIYTTHETELLNQQELLRPDEVWFAQKTEGQTKLYSLNDFKEHNTINIRNGYLDGRYGAIPFIGDLNE